MRKVSIVFAAALAALTVNAGVAGAQGALKFGAGVHFDEKMPGVCASIDIPLGGSYYAFSPFAEAFFKGDNSVAGVGLNLMVKRPSGQKTLMYVAAGGGLGYVKSVRDRSEVDDDGQQVFETLEASKSQILANALIGLEYASTERASIFVQAKWVGMFGGGQTVVTLSNGTTTTADLDVKNLAVQVGVAFHLGDREGELDY